VFDATAFDVKSHAGNELLKASKLDTSLFTFDNPLIVATLLANILEFHIQAGNWLLKPNRTFTFEYIVFEFQIHEGI